MVATAATGAAGVSVNICVITGGMTGASVVAAWWSSYLLEIIKSIRGMHTSFFVKMFLSGKELIRQNVCNMHLMVTAYRILLHALSTMFH